MDTEKRKKFIIDFMYLAIIFLIAFAAVRYGLSLLAPFVAAFLTAYLLRGLIGFLSRRLRLGWKTAAIVTVLLFYGTIGILLVLLGVKALSALSAFVVNLPGIYTSHVEPVLTNIFAGIEQSSLQMDPALLAALSELWGQFVQSLGQMVSGLSVRAMGGLSGFASSLPGFFIKVLLTVISTFFIAADYNRLTGFCLNQLDERAKKVFLQIKEYVVGTLFVCFRSYALIMTITFVELSVGLTIIGIENSILIALCIAVFDVLPVLGTGGIMIPWAVITSLQGDYPLALEILAVYLFVTVIRNILEPKIVGSQIGLHPVVTLAGMFVGAQMFGIFGLFGVPIGLSLLCHLNDTGTVKLFRPSGREI